MAENEGVTGVAEDMSVSDEGVSGTEDVQGASTENDIQTLPAEGAEEQTGSPEMISREVLEAQLERERRHWQSVHDRQIAELKREMSVNTNQPTPPQSQNVAPSSSDFNEEFANALDESPAKAREVFARSVQEQVRAQMEAYQQQQQEQVQRQEYLQNYAGEFERVTNGFKPEEIERAKAIVQESLTSDGMPTVSAMEAAVQAMAGNQMTAIEMMRRGMQVAPQQSQQSAQQQAPAMPGGPAGNVPVQTQQPPARPNNVLRNELGWQV